MTTERKEPGQQNGQKLDDIVQGADEYYNYLRQKHVSDTRLDGVIVGLVVWFASFVVLGVGAITTVSQNAVPRYLLGAAGAAIFIGLVAGILTYTIRRKGGFKFTELAALVAKMKQGVVSSEDGLRLMDAMHQASLALKRRKLVSAFEYGVATFALVSIVSLNAGFGALAGVIVYLYLRFEALREYEHGEERYENSKKALLQSL